MRRILIFLFILPILLSGQSLHSIENLSLAELSDSVAVCRNSNVERYGYFIKALIGKAKLNNNTFFEAVGYKEQGFYYLIKSDLDSAEVCLDKANLFLGALRGDSIQDQRISTKIFQGLVAQEKFEYVEAMKLWREIYEESVEIDRKADIASSQYMIANIYMAGKQYKTAFEYFKKGRPAVTSLDDADIELLGWWHDNIGECYFRSQEFEKAKMHWDSALIIWDHLEMVRAKGYLYNFYGDLCIIQNSDKSLYYYTKALELNKKMGNETQFLRAQIGVGAYYENKKDILTAAKSYSKALRYGIESALRIELIPALDFFIKKPEYSHELDIPIIDLLSMRIKAQDQLHQKNAIKDIKLTEAFDSIKFAEEREKIANENARKFKNLSFLLTFVMSVSLLLLYFFVRNTKRLKVSTNKIAEQYQLITKQSKQQEKHLENIKNLNTNLKDRVIQLDYQRQLLDEKNSELKGVLNERTKVVDRLKKFASILSHDMKEPIRTIFSFSQIFERRVRDKLESSENELLAFISEGSLRAYNMVGALYQYSNATLAIMNDIEEVDINVIIKGVIADLRHLIQETEADIKYDDFPIIKGQSALLRRLFQNLISNSLKYSKQGVAPRIFISNERRGRMIFMKIIDNGKGIKPEEIATIFHLFRRGGDTKGKDGLGLGLAICKEIVTVHGGEIFVESKFGVGTTISFTLDMQPGN